MKILLSIALICCMCGSALAQNSEIGRPVNVKEWKAIYFKTNPLAILQGPIFACSEYRFGFEAMAAPRLSYQPSISYLGKSPLFPLLFSDTALGGLSSSDFLFRGYRLQGQLRYFLFNFSKREPGYEMRPFGIYTALHASYSTATLRFRGRPAPRITFNHFNINGLLGMQLLISDHVGIDFFAGLGYKRNTIFEEDFNNVISQVDLSPDEFGFYYASNIKVNLGFNIAIGLW